MFENAAIDFGRLPQFAAIIKLPLSSVFALRNHPSSQTPADAPATKQNSLFDVFVKAQNKGSREGVRV